MTSEPPHIRVEQPADAEAIDQIVSAAFLAGFGTTSEAPLVRTMRERCELVPDLTLVAETPHGVVGFIALSEVTLDGQQCRGLAIAPVAVSPASQSSGIGSLLVSTALTLAEQTHWRFVVLLGHTEYYPRFGFTPAADHSLTGDYGDHDSWMVRSLGSKDLPSGHVRYCSAFDD